MFNILKFSVDEITGTAEVKICYQSNINSEILNDGGTFTSRDSALIWLNDVKKKWFGIKLDNYLCHKRHIYETIPRGHKSITAKLTALEELFRFAKWTAEKATLQEACTWLLKELDKLEFILPGQNNPSRESSEKELKLLTDFAKAQLKSK